jgi:hypothetical protein
LLIVHGVYQFRPTRVAFRNDYCLACAQPRRAVQIRSFDAGHVFWIPVLPLGFHKRWRCTNCDREPHIYPGTRHGFKWAGLVVLLIFTAATWAVQLTPDVLVLGWVLRIGSPLGTILTIAHLLRTPQDPSLKERLAAVPHASDTACPFCGSVLLLLSSQCTCPKCGVVRV